MQKSSAKADKYARPLSKILATSSLEDSMAVMANTPPTFLQEIETFLAEYSMGASYFGKRAAGNSELVSRLRDNRRVWPETETKVRSFMMLYRVLNGGHGVEQDARQVQHSNRDAV